MEDVWTRNFGDEELKGHICRSDDQIACLTICDVVRVRSAFRRAVILGAVRCDPVFFSAHTRAHKHR